MYLRISLLLLLPLIGVAQLPNKINFQSILRNTNGEVVSNKSVSLKISILSGSINGSLVYSETHTKTTDASGLISLQIGNGTLLSGVFVSISWGDFPHFIKLEADFSGGSNYVVLGTQELMSVPYALYASKTDTSSLNLVNRFNSKVNVSDTSNMLSNYRTGLNAKINTTDTSTMLSNYLRKADDIIADLQLQIKQLQSLSNVIDIDGNSYKTVKIGSQIWMSENLKVTKYRNGESIPNVTNNYEWSNLNIGAWNINQDVTIYGRLYNWFTVSDNRGLCPNGWHVPSLEEWNILVDFLGGEEIAGAKLKATTLWDSNEGATNESGFAAFANGFALINTGNLHVDNGNLGFFWSSSPWSDWGAISKKLWTITNDIKNHIGDKKNGFSVRCLRD
jgi:uncharacterized protein (TIGR02145 family)